MPERPVDLPRARRAVEELLAALGYDPAAPELATTPDRVVTYAAEAWAQRPLPGIDASGRMPAEGTGPVVLDGIPFRAVCEHHLLPFTGTAAIVYAPGAWIAGVGRLVDVVDVAARRLQVQERLVELVADAVQQSLEPEGVLVRATATHACMWARGIGTEATALTATAARGRYAQPAGRLEALALLGAS